MTYFIEYRFADDEWEPFSARVFDEAVARPLLCFLRALMPGDQWRAVEADNGGVQVW